MAVTDTSAEAKAVQRAAFARMTREDRALAAMAMAETVKQVALAGIRRRHPYYDDAAVHRAWFILLHGPELAAKVLGPSTT